MKNTLHNLQRLRPAPGRGFTLIELMIAVVIIGILAAVSAPTIARSVERNRINDLNRAIANGFLEARSFAMSSGQVVYARIDVANDEIHFFRPTNFAAGDAFDCFVAQGANAAVNDANRLLTINFAESGTRQELQGNAPAPANGALCIAPSGRIFNSNGEIPFSNCGDMNYLLWLGEAAPAQNCPNLLSQDERIERQLDNIYFLHVSHTGNVRVMQ